MAEVMEVFGATSTTEDVLAGVNLRGKRILVTGVSTRLGVETAGPRSSGDGHMGFHLA